MSRLLVDIGNTRVKWVWAGPGGVPDQAAAGDPDDLFRAARGIDADAVAIAATGGEQLVEAVTAGARSRWPDASIRRVTTAGRFGRLVNSYQDPARMGVDRWLAMIGAELDTAGAFCVIDAGTALTVDLVAADGHHRGGWIAPGLALMRHGLAAGTARIGADLAPPQPGPWGRSTGAAVHAGTLAALIGTVEQAVSLALAEDAATTFVLTGGDAVLVKPMVASASSSVSIQPMLVFRGLHRWLARATHEAGQAC